MCQKGTYGPHCLDSCSPHCLRGALECDIADGACIGDCVAGYTPPLCRDGKHKSGFLLLANIFFFFWKFFCFLQVLFYFNFFSFFFIWSRVLIYCFPLLVVPQSLTWRTSQINLLDSYRNSVEPVSAMVNEVFPWWWTSPIHHAAVIKRADFMGFDAMFRAMALYPYPDFKYICFPCVKSAASHASINVCLAIWLSWDLVWVYIGLKVVNPFHIIWWSGFLVYAPSQCGLILYLKGLVIDIVFLYPQSRTSWLN